jgi:proteasome lid subunit RPN8/RPN11
MTAAAAPVANPGSVYYRYVPTAPPVESVLLPEPVRRRLLATAGAVHAAGLTSFGLLVAPPAHPAFPFVATDAVFFDPLRNRRNDPAHRAAFEAQGEYFRSHDDAGFVADAGEVLDVVRRVEAAGLEIVATFHARPRQPASFSAIDFRLHDPAIPWHLVISLSDPGRPVIRAFAVRKDPSDFGIGADDDNEGSEQQYTGPEVTTLELFSPSSVPPAWGAVFGTPAAVA